MLALELVEVTWLLLQIVVFTIKLPEIDFVFVIDLAAFRKTFDLEMSLLLVVSDSLSGIGLKVLAP